ncbi:methyltransferase domain-containing protein [Nocardioides sp. NPDC127503]|uniref:methyltransferase domain-containing protein n=1 Tax=Nocardioides sp. NPDC127503 TaxID=3154516 RepID=UPI0033244CB2
MRLAPELHYLAAGYEQRIPPTYFSDDVDDGITWQPDVCPETLALARRHRRGVIIDLGCGRANKLTALHAAAPEIDIVGVDYGPNIDWCRTNRERGTWIDADLETVADLPLTDDLVADSVVVCSDVLEHLIDPRPTMRLIVDLLNRGCACGVLSTPARDLRVGADYIGVPRNLAHVREWTQEEFQAFVRSFGVCIERAELTRSDDSGGGLTTQLLVVTKAAWA